MRRSPLPFTALMMLTAMLLASRNDTLASVSASPEQECLKHRYYASAHYADCEQKVLGVLFDGHPAIELQRRLSKCRVKYTAMWDRLVAEGSGSTTCVGARFVDNGDGTVIDNLTTLQWERKSNLDGTPNFSDPHDADNTYPWSATTTAADGTVYTGFLPALNDGACFAGQCDWRLPTIDELQTILAEPCTTSPCIAPIFGPTAVSSTDTHSIAYWSSTTFAGPPGPTYAWQVAFDDGSVDSWNQKTFAHSARAVRGGL